MGRYWHVNDGMGVYTGEYMVAWVDTGPYIMVWVDISQYMMVCVDTGQYISSHHVHSRCRDMKRKSSKA